MLDLSIVIVNYNVKNLLRECLLSIRSGLNGLQAETIIVDNRSSDGSAAMVAEEFPDFQLLVAPENGGYAYGNNLALRQILARRDQLGQLPRYVLLLNPDTVVPPGALSAMVTFLDHHPEAGAAGPRLIRPDGSLDLACRRSFPSPQVALYRMLGLSKLFPRHPRFARYNLTNLDPADTVEVDSVVGAFMMIRGEILDQVGLLDETFFMYGEDLDWAYRIKQHGWRIIYHGSVQVIHYKGASSSQRSTKTTIEFYRAMLVFYHKHYAQSTPLLLGWLVIVGIYAKAAIAVGINLVRRLLHFTRRQRPAEPNAKPSRPAQV